MKSVHTMGIQNSKYIMVEDNVEVISQYLKDNQEHWKCFNDKIADKYSHFTREPDLCLKYCHQDDV